MRPHKTHQRMLIDQRQLDHLLHTSIDSARDAARHADIETLCTARDLARDGRKTGLQKVLQAEINRREKTAAR